MYRTNKFWANIDNDKVITASSKKPFRNAISYEEKMQRKMKEIRANRIGSTRSIGQHDELDRRIQAANMVNNFNR